MLKLIIFLLISFVAFSTSVFAGFLDLPAEFRDPCLNPDGRTIYLKPNETRPHRARPILEKAPQGAYMAVGTERGILSAVQAPRITHLIMADMNPTVCVFNNINFALIKLSKGDRAVYQFLRQQASFEEWQKHLAENKDLSKVQREFLTSDQHYQFWKTATKVGNPANDFEKGEFENHFIGDVHYVVNEKAFQKIYQLVESNKVESIYLELNDNTHLQQLGSAMKKIGLYLSVLDISNAWYKSYLGHEKVKKMVEQVQSAFLLNPASFVMGTCASFKLPDSAMDTPGEVSVGSLFSRYTAYTFNYFNDHPIAFEFEKSYDGAIDNRFANSHEKTCDEILL